MLRVGVEPRDGDADVAVQHVAPLDDRIVAELLGVDALPLHLDARLEPGAEAQVVRPAAATTTPGRSVRVVPGTMTLSENIVSIICQTSVGHLAEERLLFRQPRRDELERQALGVA